MILCYEQPWGRGIRHRFSTEPEFGEFGKAVVSQAEEA
jgi:hypothetical protein